MPNYEYKCPSCDYKEEQIHKIGQTIHAVMKACPNCLRDNLVRGPGGGLGFQFKCKGFYDTDYNGK